MFSARASHILIKWDNETPEAKKIAKEKAEAAGVHGWVRNTVEGNVELMACGTDQSLEKFIAWCHQGPEKSKVTEVIVKPITEEANFQGFEIMR